MSTQSLAAPTQHAPCIRTSLWQRLLLPSLSDVFFFFVLAWSFLSSPSGWQRLLIDGDTGLHLGVGQYILTHHQVPVRDVFSFSMPGRPWYAFEWLSETFFAALNAAWGLKGVVLVAGLMIAAVLTILFRHALWRKANVLIAVLVVLGGANTLNLHFFARPHLFTLLLLSMAAWLVARDRVETTRYVWLLVPLSTLWANLHGGFFIFIAWLALLTAGSALEAVVWPQLRAPRRAAALRYGLLTVLCSLATLVNPYGIGLHRHIVEALRSSSELDFSTEFQSPVFRSEPLFAFMALMFLGLIACGSLARKRRLVEPLWIVFLAYCSLVSVRHATIYVVVVVPILAAEITIWWNTWTAGLGRNSVPRILDEAVAPLAAVGRRTSLWLPLMIVVLALAPGIAWPRDFPEDLFPVKLIRRHAAEMASARVFTTDQWSDYLVYVNFPRQRVFMDSRHNYYGALIEDDYQALLHGRPRWKALVERYRLDMVLSPADAALTSLLTEDPGWKVAGRDDKAVLFVRKGS